MQSSALTPFRLGTFSAAGGQRFAGIVVGERVLSLRDASEYLAGSGSAIHSTEMLAMLEHWDRNFPLLQQAANALDHDSELTRRATAVASLAVHPPIDLPRQIFCSGANYKRHVVQIIMAQVPEETRGMTTEERRAYGERKMDERAARGTPFCFVKAQSSVSGPFDPIALPHDVQQPDWELSWLLSSDARHDA